MSTFTIFEQVFPAPAGFLPYRLVETFSTVDGIRSRLTHQSFHTFEEALAKAMELGGSNVVPFPEIFS